MRYNDETKFLDLFDDPEVIEIFEKESPGFLFYLMSTPLWKSLRKETLGTALEIYDSVLETNLEEVKRILNSIKKLS